MDTSTSGLRLETLPPAAASAAACAADGMPRGILAVIDASKSGVNAAWRAAVVARDHGRPLQLVTLLSQADDASAARARLQELAGRLEQRIQVHTTTAVVAGELRDHAVALAAGRELVVAPWRRSATWAERVLGTWPERLLRWLDAPVLIVRRPATSSYRRVLAPVKLDADAERQLSVARHMARGQGLRVFHVLEAGPEDSLRLADVPGEALELYRQRRRERAYAQLNALMDRAGVAAAGAAALVGTGHVAARVMEAARRQNVQLIVAGTGRRSFFSDVVCGGLVQDVLRDAEADVLVVPRLRPASGGWKARHAG